MHRGLVCLFLLAPSAVASADDHLDLGIPDLTLLEPSYHLDRGQDAEHRSKAGYTGWLGAGVARVDDTASPVGSGVLGAGRHSDTLIALWRSDLAADTVHGFRGRHRGLLELRSDYDSDVGLDETVTDSIEHGEARALAPVRLGPGRRETGELASETLIQLGTDHGDARWVGMVKGELGGTHWEEGSAPAIDHEMHRALSLGLGAAPADGELPRGHFNILRGRVEHERITARAIATPADGTPRPSNAAGGEVRTIDVGFGADQMTLYIDHEMLAILEADLGWSWIESDTGAGRIADNAFRMRFAAAFKWKPSRETAVRRVGLSFARLPSPTADGQRIVGDWRLELQNGVETSLYLIEARGGLSWIVPFAGGDPAVPAQTLVRYGAELDAFAKLGAGLEAGIYHASSYEPRIAGDPWATARRWSVETGLLARIRK